MAWEIGTCPITFNDGCLKYGTRQVEIHAVEFSDIGHGKFHYLRLTTAYGEGRFTFHQDGSGNYSCTLVCPERISAFEWTVQGAMNPQDLHGVLSALFKECAQSFLLDMTKQAQKPIPQIKISK